MIEQLLAILHFMGGALLQVWPYLLITIPLAVAVNLSGASRYITRALTARPWLAILLATVVGAFSPFCSCSVIPVVASLLIGGVPLAPVMSFWIASPSMDPETFFLSVAMLGWPLAVWRLAGTLLLSLAAGFLTQLFMSRGWLGEKILRTDYEASHAAGAGRWRAGWRRVRILLGQLPLLPTPAPLMAASTVVPAGTVAPLSGSASTSSGDDRTPCGTGEGSSCTLSPPRFRDRLLEETWAATTMVARFMALAFFLEALIALYVPQSWITGLLGPQNPLAIVTAAFLGVPLYTSNLAALPMIGGLLEQGMQPAAALAFLIAGPTTTLPAMAAVSGLVQKRVFALYVAFALVGALLLGYAYQMVGGF